jgi:fatty-acyl-CoA synthase
MLGLMQDWPLTVDKILDHAARWHGAREVVTRRVEDGEVERTTYGAIYTRAKQLSHALREAGIQPGDRVATLGWNTSRHMEAWYGIMGIGAVCHTLNPRLHPEQLAYIINHAGDRMVFVDLTFAPLLGAVLPACPKVTGVVVMTDGAHMPADGKLGPAAIAFDDWIAGRPTDTAWGGFGEETACGLCYTSGTTGNPKGVLYSHRSNFIHTLLTMQKDVMGCSVQDVVLPVVPMFHANAWGVAFSAPAAGAKLVMPGARMDGAAIHELLETEGVTFSAAVPTVWLMLLQHLRATGGKISTLRKVVIGGSACPEALIRAFQDDYGVEVIHAWGMTETSPLGTTGTLTPEVEALPYDAQMPMRLKQGRAPIGVELTLKDEAGTELPRDGVAQGRLMVRGAIVAGAYFGGEGGHILDADGWFDTGDVATIDPQGFMQITDRAKDVIKSGGEWISSIDIENIAVGHPKAELAAAIGVKHPKWDERPLLLMKLKAGETATRDEILSWMEGKVARWQLPDDVVFVDDIPLGATGKIDKKVLRAKYEDYQLPTALASVSDIA